MEITFKDKVALVTWAYGGIGLATAKAFAKSGAKFAMADINPQIIEQAEKLKSDGYEVIGIVADASDENQVRSMVEKTVKTFGKLDCAYNNVGIHAPVMKTAELDSKDFNKVISVNLTGCFYCMKYEVIEMQKNKGGAIVNCSSQSGIVGTAGLCAYTASKHGLIGLTKCTALEYARQNIRVNTICPGTSDTPMVQDAIAKAPEHMAKIIDDIPLGRMGTADEIAAAVLFLCSDYAAFTIGQVFVADGGYTVV